MSARTAPSRRMPSLRRASADAPVSKRVIALVSAAALVGGLFIGSGIARALGPKEAAAPARSAALPPSGTNPVGAGPARFEGMVPVGYQHTEGGAVAAAASYSSMMTEMVFRPEFEARAAARSVAVPEGADIVEVSMLKPISSIRQAFAVAGQTNPNGRALVRTTPIGTRTVSYAPDRARIDVWVMSTFAVEVQAQPGTSPAPSAQAMFSMTSFLLVWSAGDWKVADMKTAGDAGPALTRATPMPATPFIDQATTFTPFRYLANRGGQG